MEQFSTELRLGDVIDDHCIKCRRVTNHSIVSLVDGKAAKVRCRTCYHDHDYRNEQAPPTKKELLKQALFDQVLAAGGPSSAATSVDNLDAIGDDPDAIAAALAAWHDGVSAGGPAVTLPDALCAALHANGPAETRADYVTVPVPDASVGGQFIDDILQQLKAQRVSSEQAGDSRD